MIFPPTRGHYYDKDDIMYTVLCYVAGLTWNVKQGFHWNNGFFPPIKQKIQIAKIHTICILYKLISVLLQENSRNEPGGLIWGFHNDKERKSRAGSIKMSINCWTCSISYRRHHVIWLLSNVGYSTNGFQCLITNIRNVMLFGHKQSPRNTEALVYNTPPFYIFVSKSLVDC